MTKQKSIIADLILAAVGIVCLAALLYLAYSYGWTGERRFTSWWGLVVYYAIPGILGLLSFFSLRLKPAQRRMAAACCFLVVASAYGSELFFGLSDPGLVQATQPVMSFPASERRKIAAQLTRQFGIAIDTRDPGEVVAALRVEGIEAVPQLIVPPHERETEADLGSRIVPLGGISNRHTVVCNQNGEYLTYKSDERGFHNPEGVWQSGRFDIAAVGNSFTFGYCVPSGRSFVGLIRKQYPATVNLGMPGEGPLHVLGVINEYAAALKPDTVLWFYSEGSSFLELRTEMRSPTLLRYLRGEFTQGLLERQSDVDRAAQLYLDRQMELDGDTAVPMPENRRFIDNLLAFIKLNALRQNAGLIYGAAAPEQEAFRGLEAASGLQTEMNLLRDIFSEVKVRINEWGGKLYFVYLPDPGRYFGNPPPGSEKRTEILSFVRSLDIPVIDIYSAFQVHRDPLSLFPFRRPGHPNEQGHRLIAEMVLDRIASRN